MLVKEPSDFLKKAIGQNVRIKLNSGVSYKGILYIINLLNILIFKEF